MLGSSTSVRKCTRAMSRTADAGVDDASSHDSSLSSAASGLSGSKMPCRYGRTVPKKKVHSSTSRVVKRSSGTMASFSLIVVMPTAIIVRKSLRIMPTPSVLISLLRAQPPDLPRCRRASVPSVAGRPDERARAAPCAARTGRRRSGSRSCPAARRRRRAAARPPGCTATSRRPAPGRRRQSRPSRGGNQIK